MSLTDSPDILFRPEDKALKMLFPSPGMPTHELTDDFFDKELYELNHIGEDKESHFLDDIFAMDYVQNSSPSLNKTPPIFEQEHTPQPWRKGLWCLSSNSASELAVEKTRKTNHVFPTFVSPTHLMGRDHFANGNFDSRSALSTKRTLTRPKPDRSNNPHAAPMSTREQTFSPTPVHSRSHPHGKMGYNEMWERDLQNFHLQMPDNGTYLSPQHVHGPRSGELALRQANSRIRANNAVASHNPGSPTKYHYPFSHVRRTEKPCSVSDAVHQWAHLPSNVSNAKAEQPRLATLPARLVDSSGAPVWTTESLHSSDSSQYSSGSHYSSETHQQIYAGLPAATWVSPPPTKPVVYPRSETSSSIAAPVPRRIVHRMLDEQQAAAGYPGLGIQYPAVDDIGRAFSYEPSDNEQTIQYNAVASSAPIAPAIFPPLPAYPSYPFSDISSLATPRRRADSQSHSPSPSPSPTRRAVSQGPGQRSLSRNDSGHNRRKSIHKGGPVKDGATTDGRRRTRSSSRPPRTPKTPKTPKTPQTPASAGLTPIGFVNYTPKDSIKLMTDVAPSGSSRTRARREQEAKEKRKRLSEAAFQAVRKAGGDVKALEAAILA